MTKQGIKNRLKPPSFYLLFFIVFLSCASLVFINYGTIRIVSANRACVNGESHYSKGIKDAARHLTTYLYTNNKEEWAAFLKEIKVPKGDGAARIALLQNKSEQEIKKELRVGRNEEEDLDDLIWLYKSFKSVSFYVQALQKWSEADVLIEELDKIGQEIHQKLSVSNINAKQEKAYLLRIGTISDKLTTTTHDFSNILTNGFRKFKMYLVFANVFFILVIISSVSIYFSIMVKKMLESAKEIESKNKTLLLANKELDSFVYSASHDLRSPITTLKGLIEIAKEENDLNQIRYYFGLMNQSLSMQDRFINNIIDYSKNKRKEKVRETVSFTKIVNEVVLQYSYLIEAKAIKIVKKIAVDEIESDGLRLKIILNNLVSNAIKYSDKDKKNKFVEIALHNEEHAFKIEVNDNGVGINKEIQTKIFEMFFGTDHNLGSGLGLYIAKEAVENLNGSITVSSLVNQGSTFTLVIPKCHEI